MPGKPAKDGATGGSPPHWTSPLRTSLACLGQAAHLRWRSRGQIDRVSLFGTAKGARPVDVTPAGRQGCGTEYRCPGQRQHDRADVKKNILKPHLKEQFVIPPAANAAFVAAMRRSR